MSATGSVNLIALLLLRRPFASAFGALAEEPAAALLAGCARARAPALLVKLIYQDDFETPGISPRSARPRKHKRQSPNFRK
jgi:hypothetical protein